jgi:hypothetical protein
VYVLDVYNYYYVDFETAHKGKEGERLNLCQDEGGPLHKNLENTGLS